MLQAAAALPLLVRRLGRIGYGETYAAMRAFTACRGAASADELWLCEHEPVYTLGVAARAAHLHPGAAAIAHVQTDRGGQVTYHGPGQMVAYPLVDLRRLEGGRGIFVKDYVFRLEQALLRTLAAYGVVGHRVRGAPGVYVRRGAPFDHARLAPDIDAASLGQPRAAELGKIAALGIKLARHCSYHGVALNVAMDLRPFAEIDPCGYSGLATVDLATLGVSTDVAEAGGRFSAALADLLGLDAVDAPAQLPAVPTATP